MTKSDLHSKEYIPYHGYYINKNPDININEALDRSYSLLLKHIENLSEEKANYRYEEGKWTIKELLLHLIDTERIFVYRALRFSRGDFSKALPFEQDDYVLHCDAHHRSLSSILKEYSSVRNCTKIFFDNLSDSQLCQIEERNAESSSPRALAYFIAGHELHHTEVLINRYLK